jgi:hypothetical protein
MGLALGALLLPGCATPGGSPNPAPRAFCAFPSEQQQIYQALFDHMFAHWRNNPFHLPERFFLRIGGYDSPDDLLARFTAQGYTVAPGYRYKHDHGIRCSADAIRFDSPTRATVYGGYLFGPLGGEWGPFVLLKRKDKWTVVSWKPDLFA